MLIFNRVIYFPIIFILELVKLQEQMLNNLKIETDKKKHQIDKLKHDLDELRHEIERRNRPIISQNDIEKLKEEIRNLTNRKAELEINIRKSLY